MSEIKIASRSYRAKVSSMAIVIALVLAIALINTVDLKSVVFWTQVWAWVLVVVSMVPLVYYYIILRMDHVPGIQLRAIILVLAIWLAGMWPVAYFTIPVFGPSPAVPGFMLSGTIEEYEKAKENPQKILLQHEQSKQKKKGKKKDKKQQSRVSATALNTAKIITGDWPCGCILISSIWWMIFYVIFTAGICFFGVIPDEE